MMPIGASVAAEGLFLVVDGRRLHDCLDNGGFAAEVGRHRIHISNSCDEESRRLARNRTVSINKAPSTGAMMPSEFVFDTEQGFRSPGGLQRFLTVFSEVQNLFVTSRQKRSALAIHLHRLRAIAHWNPVANVFA